VDNERQCNESVSTCEAVLIGEAYPKNCSGPFVMTKQVMVLDERFSYRHAVMQSWMISLKVESVCVSTNIY
jgi:hypothetical protein